VPQLQEEAKHEAKIVVCSMYEYQVKSSLINLLPVLHEPMLVAMPCSTDCLCVMLLHLVKMDQSIIF